MNEVWVEVTADSIRGDRDGLVELRTWINVALSKGTMQTYLEDEDGMDHEVRIERVGP